MSAIEDAIKFVAQHILGLSIVAVILGIAGFLIFLSAPGQSLVKFLNDNPFFLFLAALNFLGYIGLYIWMLRPKDPEAERLGPLETFERWEKEGWMTQYGLERVGPILVRTHPKCGRLFWPLKMKDLFSVTKQVSVLVSDKRNIKDRTLDIFDEILSKEEVDKYFKKAMSLDEMLIIGKRADMQLASLAKKTEETTELYGVPKA